jgi:hypothetical protein
MLVPNRPISEVTVFGSQSESPVHLSAEELMPLLMDIASSSAPLESLVLPGADPTLGCLIFIAKRFPQLRQLSMVIQETGTRVVEGRPDPHDRSGPSKPFPVLRRNKLPDITSASNVHVRTNSMFITSVAHESAEYLTLDFLWGYLASTEVGSAEAGGRCDCPGIFFFFAASAGCEGGVSLVSRSARAAPA